MIEIFLIVIVFILVVSYIVWKDEKSSKHKMLNESLDTLLNRLEKEASDYPNKTISEFLREYSSVPSQISLPKSSEPSPEVSGSLENWYSNNSVNLLLYIGAFLMVASASIFVGFAWETIGGFVKTLLILGLTVGFFLFGRWFYKIPKVRSAGVTFVAIGAILIPICGLAFYNFVLKDIGFPLGGVWLLTSLISLLTYVVLSTKMKSKFYGYFSSLSTISASLSMVNIFGLNSSFYILAAIISCFALLLAKTVLAAKSQTNEDVNENIIAPLEMSSNIVMPISILFGLYTAIWNDKLYSIESVLAVFVASLFYILSYMLDRKIWSLLIGIIMIPLSLYLLSKNQKWEDIMLLYSFGILSYSYLGVANYLHKIKQLSQESFSLIMVANGLLVVNYILALTGGLSHLDLMKFGLLAGLGGFFSYWVTRMPRFLSLTTLFTGVTLFNVVYHLKLDQEDYIFPTIYALLGLICYFMSVKTKSHPEYLKVFGGSCVSFLVAAMLFSMGDSGYMILITALLSVLAFLSIFEFADPKFVYLSNMFLYYCLYNYLDYFKVENSAEPLFFTGLTVVLYIASLVIKNSLRDFYKNTSMIAVMAVPLLYGINSKVFSLGSTNSEKEFNSLISSYVSTIILIFDTVLEKNRKVGYLASGMALVTYLWQVNLLDLKESFFYTFPIGLFFIGHAYYQRRINKTENSKALEYIGLFFLLVPTFFESQGEDGYLYALALGLIGVGLIVLGNSWNYKNYKYFGTAAIVLAVVSQTFEYALSLPRWLITGIGGLTFLIIAVYLLSRRKDQES